MSSLIYDITIEKLQSAHSRVDLNFHHPPELITKNALIFDSEQMEIWWEQGYQFAKNNSPFRKCLEIEK